MKARREALLERRAIGRKRSWGSETSAGVRKTRSAADAALARVHDADSDSLVSKRLRPRIA